MPDLREIGDRDRLQFPNRPWLGNDGRFAERLRDRLLADDLLGSFNDRFRRNRMRGSDKGPVPVYWSRSRNFGDAMAPRVFEAASGCRTAWVTKRFCGKVVLQGSVLGWALAPKDVVWGAGLLLPEQVRIPDNVTFLAVRGPLTRKFIAADVPDLYSDPGVLAPLLYDSAPSKEYSIGIVPHYVDHPYMTSDDPRVLVIDVLRPVREVVHMITSCEVVLSSSLHGIIVAEAFGIPAAWISCGDRLPGGEFKFRDYYLGTDREPRNPVAWSDGIPRAVAQVRESGIYRGHELLAAIAKAIPELRGPND